MNPSNWFRTGGGPCTLPNLGCLPIIIRWGLALSGLVILIVLCAFT